jgi:transcriptional antiterminator Rof (Rho-off)
VAEVNILHVISSVAVVMIGIGVGDVIRRLYRIEKKQDDQSASEAACRLELAEHYVKWVDLTGPDGRITKIEADRLDKWKKQELINLDVTKMKTKLEMGK